MPVWLLFIITLVGLTFGTSDWINSFYLPWIFYPIRWIYAKSFYHLPFAFIYLVVPVFGWLVFKFYRWTRKDVPSLLFKISFLISILLFIFTWFYGSWGLLYKNKQLSEKINLKDTPIDTLYLLEQLQWTENTLLHVRSLFWNNHNQAIPLDKKPKNLEVLLQKEVAATLNTWGYVASEKVRVRPLYPAGSLLIFSTAGIYLPFSMEGHYDPGLAHFHSPFVMAHELGHAYGITGEADCNFIALISCLRSKEPFIQYAGLLTYWRYLSSDLRRSAKYSFYKMAFGRPMPIRKDLELLYQALDRYPEVMPMLRDIIYDSYLKANGLQDGLKNYDKILHLMRSWQKSNWDQDIKTRWGMNHKS